MKTVQDNYIRNDLAAEAIVRAAVKLRGKLGDEATVDFLVDAGIPSDVIARIMGGGPLRGAGTGS